MYKGFYYIYIVAKNTVEQKRKVFFQMLNHIVFFLFSIYLYRYVYNLLPGLSSKIPFPNAIWSMAMYFMVFSLGIRFLEKHIREDIRSGNIEMYMLRPIGYIWQKVLILLGQGLFSFTFAIIIYLVFGSFLVGSPIINTPVVPWILGVIVILVLSQVLLCLIMILCGLTGFWLENSEPVNFLVSKLIMIFGGAWVPVAFFPKAFQIFAKFSPFGGAMAVSFTMYPNFSELFPLLLGNVIFWIIVFFIIVNVVSKKAFRNLAVNG